jgi:hypothetical protein
MEYSGLVIIPCPVFVLTANVALALSRRIFLRAGYTRGVELPNQRLFWRTVPITPPRKNLELILSV